MELLPRPRFAFIKKLKGLKCHLIKWNRESFGIVELSLKKVQDSIDELGKLEEVGGMNSALNAKRSKLKATGL